MQATRAEREEGPDVDFSAIHEEIARLPERYREPLVLCHLEAMTHEAAAEVLGCPVGTVSVRLMRARERLKARLSRRGFLIPGGLSPVRNLPGPAVSARLVETTGRIALAFSARRATVAGVVPAPVLTLAQGVLKSMVVTQWKLTALFLLPVLLVGVGGGVILGQGTTAGQGPGGPPRAANRADPPPAKAIDPVEKAEPADDPDAAARKHLVESARRRRDIQRRFYMEGRITLDRYLDALSEVEDAEVAAAATHEEKITAVAHYVEEIKEVEARERAAHEAARSTMADVEEAALRRELAEMELRQTKRSAGHLDLESLDRRIGALERKLDLILKALPRSAAPK